MTLTLEIPAELDGDRRKALASALAEAGLVSSEQVAALLKEALNAGIESPTLLQGSSEWKALLYQQGTGQGVILTPEATSREAIYGDDSR